MSTKSACLFSLLTAAVLWAEEAPPTNPNKEAAKLDLANSGDGSVPGGATVVAGKWSVDADSKTLRALPEPILENWLEFGPEIREKGATIRASGKTPADGTLRSRLGVGLYGKNGVQLRYVDGTKKLELVRRGEVLTSVSFASKENALVHFELTAEPERSHWLFFGRAWIDEEERPDKPTIQHKLFESELLFPVAGRAVLVATPFSGEAVEYHEATVYHGRYQPEPKMEKAEEPKKP